MKSFDAAIVTGATGFIGGHLCKSLAKKGIPVVGIDVKTHDYTQVLPVVDYRIVDLVDDVEGALWNFHNVRDTLGKVAVFALAADMGGMGHISQHPYTVMKNNLAINRTTLHAAEAIGVEHYFFASSVCVYPKLNQMGLGVFNTPQPMEESLAYPASPMDSYGWEKLIAEQLVTMFGEVHSTAISIARFQNTYGPYGTWTGGREKVVAALCRKVAAYKHGYNKVIQVWGDGQQLRTYGYVDDLVEGIWALVNTDYQKPVNIGPSNNDVISVNRLLLHILDIADLRVVDHIQHVSGPEGVRYRGASNRLMDELTGWKPSTPLITGLRQTYGWVEQQVLNHYRHTHSQ